MRSVRIELEEKDGKRYDKVRKATKKGHKAIYLDGMKVNEERKQA